MREDTIGWLGHEEHLRCSLEERLKFYGNAKAHISYLPKGLRKYIQAFPEEYEGYVEERRQ